MENNFLNLLNNLEKYSTPDQITILNNSLQNLSLNQCDYVLYKNLNYYILSKREEHNHHKIVEHILHNKVIFFDEIYKSHLSDYLLIYFKNEISLDIESYFQQLQLCLEHIDYKLNNSDGTLKGVVLNHLIDKFGTHSLESIFSFLQSREVVYSRNDLSTSNLSQIFKDLTLNPNQLIKYLNIEDFNLFLKSTKNLFNINNSTHVAWLRYFIDKKSTVSFLSFYNFNKLIPITELKDYFFRQNDNDFFKYLIDQNVVITNYYVEDENIESATSLKHLVKSFYGKSSKKLTRSIMNLSYKDGYFNFSFLYLGQIIGYKDINHIHTFLEQLKSSEKTIGLVRGFIDSEIPALKKLDKYIPNQLEQFFKNTKFNQFYMYVFKTKNYLDKIKFVDKEKDCERMINKLDLEIAFIKRQGYSLSYSQEIDKLCGIKFLDYQLKLPKTDKDVVMWGKILDNCLVSPVWAAKVFDKQSILIGLFQEHSLKYVIETDLQMNIKLIEGAHRERPDSSIQKMAQLFLKTI